MTQKQKVGYKVLRYNRTSVIANLGAGCGGRRYPIGTKVKPKRGYGPLCVFSNKQTAKSFALTSNNSSLIARGYIPNDLIVKCEYTPSSYFHIWENELNYRNICTLPFNTVLADSVTCLE